MSDGEPTVELDLEVLWSTYYAIRVSNGDRCAWLPKSILRPFNEGVDDYDGEEGAGDSVTLTMPEWLAIREEWV